MMVLLTACGRADGDGGGSGAPRPSTDAAVAADAVAVGEALAQLRGHHAASLEAYEAGDYKTALTHALHPVHEIMDSVRSDLDPQIAEELSATLDDGVDAVRERAPVGLVADVFQRAAAITQPALRSAVGDAADDAEYRASVVASLVTTAAHEFEEAAPHGELVLTAEYQDGYAFVKEAEELVSEFASRSEAPTVVDGLASLRELLPSLRPPQVLPTAEEVEESAASVIEGLEEEFGAHVAPPSEPGEVAENIEGLLDDVAAAYADGDAATASELAAEAYLENYEVIEPAVIEQAPEINADLEPLLGAELRREINSGASVSEIRALIAEAEELLDQAVEALE